MRLPSGQRLVWAFDTFTSSGGRRSRAAGREMLTARNTGWWILNGIWSTPQRNQGHVSGSGHGWWQHRTMVIVRIVNTAKGLESGPGFEKTGKFR